MHASKCFLIYSICYYHVIGSYVNNSTIPPEAARVKPNILMAHAIFRHGDRNPEVVCPNDPWEDPMYWPEGLGQLTNIGKLQTFKLGEWLANRYKPLFPNGYSTEIVKVYTTDLDRTMMSAATCLAGLFPPTGQQIWNSNLIWQPIPIIVLPQSIDTKIFNTMNECKLREKLYKEYMNSAEVLQIFANYQHIFDNVTAFCGDSKDVFLVLDSFKIEKLRNRTFPVWASKVLDDIKFQAFKHKSSTATPQLARLEIGFLLREIFDNFNRKKDRNERKTFVLYSAKDLTIVNILNALGIFDDILVPYAACVMFELYEENGEFYVQIIYKKIDEFSLLNIPGCGTKCPLKEIIDKYQHILPKNDYETECKNKE